MSAAVHQAHVLSRCLSPPQKMLEPSFEGLSFPSAWFCTGCAIFLSVPDAPDAERDLVVGRGGRSVRVWFKLASFRQVTGEAGLGR